MLTNIYKLFHHYNEYGILSRRINYNLLFNIIYKSKLSTMDSQIAQIIFRLRNRLYGGIEEFTDEI